MKWGEHDYVPDRLVNNQARSSSSIKLSLYMYQAKPIQRMGKNRSIKLKQASLID
jgi:hypothetical protein